MGGARPGDSVVVTTAPREALAGVGLKPQHLPDLRAGRGAVDFFEVHAENYMVAGGPYLAHLHWVRERWPLSLHGVGLSIGGDGPLDAAHLDRLAGLIERFQPRWFSEHLAWSGHGGAFLNDLLPLPYDRPTLHRVCDHIDQVQHRLGRRMLLENPSTYVEFTASTMDEGQFLTEVVARTGCELLLDVNNLYVSAINHGWNPRSALAALPLHAVREIHLAGHAHDRDAAGDALLIDDHGSAVADAVWQLFVEAVAELGPVPTLIERDNNVPAFGTLAEEAARARHLMQVRVAASAASTALARPLETLP